MSVILYEGPDFDELYSVSDLHIGGDVGFQIFDQTTKLVALVDWVGARPPDRHVALVLNGDAVDFLAEAPQAYFDVAGAAGKLRGIAGRFAPLFIALQAFLRQPNRSLVVRVGNHDLELALPHVREAFIDVLCQGDGSARSRLILELDGTGFRARVSGMRTLCVHGNEVDDWNYVGSKPLHDQIAAAKRGTTDGSWVPNGGTQLVIDVMNQVKRRFPFVDLLKPETTSAVGVLLALDPNLSSRVAGILAARVRTAKDATLRRAGLLGPESEAPGDDAPAPSDLMQDQVARRKRRIEQLREASDAALDRGLLPEEVEEDDEVLGKAGILFRRLTGQDPQRELLASLREWTAGDKGFRTDEPDDTFRALDALVSSDIDWLIAGHTHLAKSIARKSGRGRYVNTGTWARLIRLDGDLLSAARSAEVLAALKAGTMAALDGCRGLVLRRPTLAAIRPEGEGSGLYQFVERRSDPLVPVGADGHPLEG